MILKNFVVEESPLNQVCAIRGIYSFLPLREIYKNSVVNKAWSTASKNLWPILKSRSLEMWIGDDWRETTRRFLQLMTRAEEKRKYWSIDIGKIPEKKLGEILKLVRTVRYFLLNCDYCEASGASPGRPCSETCGCAWLKLSLPPVEYLCNIETVVFCTNNDRSEELFWPTLIKYLKVAKTLRFIAPSIDEALFTKPSFVSNSVTCIEFYHCAWEHYKLAERFPLARKFLYNGCGSCVQEIEVPNIVEDMTFRCACWTKGTLSLGRKLEGVKHLTLEEKTAGQYDSPQQRLQDVREAIQDFIFHLKKLETITFRLLLSSREALKANQLVPRNVRIIFETTDLFTPDFFSHNSDFYKSKFSVNVPITILQDI